MMVVDYLERTTNNKVCIHFFVFILIGPSNPFYSSLACQTCSGDALGVHGQPPAAVLIESQSSESSLLNCPFSSRRNTRTFTQQSTYLAALPPCRALETHRRQRLVSLSGWLVKHRRNERFALIECTISIITFSRSTIKTICCTRDNHRHRH